MTSLRCVQACSGWRLRRAIFTPSKCNDANRQRDSGRQARPPGQLRSVARSLASFSDRHRTPDTAPRSLRSMASRAHSTHRNHAHRSRGAGELLRYRSVSSLLSVSLSSVNTTCCSTVSVMIRAMSAAQNRHTPDQHPVSVLLDLMSPRSPLYVFSPLS